MDEIGTPFCVTVDYDSLTNDDVTVRERDSKAQVRVKIKDLPGVLKGLIEGTLEFEELG
jgi:glycyl-tRNA synthetase